MMAATMVERGGYSCSDEVHAADLNSEEIDILEEIGDGVTSVVFKGMYNGHLVAVKEMSQNPNAMTPKARLNLERELGILQSVSHPNLVTFLGADEQCGKVRIVTDFCGGGAAFDLLHNTDIDLSWRQKSQMLNDVAAAMTYLHAFQPPIIHRDLKSLNLLLKNEVLTNKDPAEVKVTDFGLSRMIEEHGGGAAVMTKNAGTCHWMAPEVFGGNHYDCKVDVYSYSMILYEIVCQVIPFGSVPANKLGLRVVRGDRPDLGELPTECPIQLCNLMMKCWAQEPSNRPDFPTITKELSLCKMEDIPDDE